MTRGILKHINYDRQFAFITSDSGEDFFMHSSGYVGDFDRLQKGDAVTFETEASPKGPRAKDVKLVPVGLAGPAA